MTTTAKGARPQQVRVMEAAIDVIVEKGLASMRISDIAERAGMSPGHVMYYFGRRDRIVTETLRYIEDMSFDGTKVALAQERPGFDRLHRYFDIGLPAGLAAPGWTLWLEAWTLAAHDGEARAAVTELEARWIGLLADLVRAGIDARAFVCEDEVEVVEQLYATLNGLAVRVVTGSGGVSRAVALERCALAAAGLLGVPSRRAKG